MAVEDEVDALYAADPDEFVEARQALVKRLRSAGDRERAAEVAKLRRPTAAAWAVNQLARRHPDDLAGLVELGQELHRAHERLLAGGRDDATVTSGRRRREAIADLVERAAGILADSGRTGDAHRDAIAATLDAASLDPDRAEDVVAGRLSKELDPPSGFGVGGGSGDDEELLWAGGGLPPDGMVALTGRARPARSWGGCGRPSRPGPWRGRWWWCWRVPPARAWPRGRPAGWRSSTPRGRATTRWPSWPPTRPPAACPSPWFRPTGAWPDGCGRSGPTSWGRGWLLDRLQS